MDILSSNEIEDILQELETICSELCLNTSNEEEQK